MTVERLAWIRECVTKQWIGDPDMVPELLAELDAVMSESQAFYEQRNYERRLVTDLRISLDAVTRERDEALKDSARLDFLNSCDPRALTSIFAMTGDGNEVRSQIDREMAVAHA
jgi:hypothetical protein